MVRQFKVMSGDELAFGQDYCAAYTIDQLPDVPGPAVVMQRGNGIRSEAMNPACTLVFKSLKCVHCKLGDVLSSNAQRRLPDLKHAKPKEKIGSEPALL